MNHDELSTQELIALEAQAAAQEATWLPLQHIAQTSAPKWQHAEESINTEGSSIHGKGTRNE